MFIYDLSTAADKMMAFDCVGENNDAWKVGPFLSAGANEVQIDRSRPYCLAISKETSVSISLVLGPEPKVGKNGGVQLSHDSSSNEFGKAERIVSKLIIIEQFEIFKDFWVRYDGPYNSKQAKKWEDRTDADVLERLKLLTDRRNELVHNDQCTPPNIREAVEFYLGLRIVSERLSDAEPYAQKALAHLMK